MPKKSKLKTKNRSADLDEIDADLEPQKARALLYQQIDEDLPGEGQFYCVTCARHFTNREALVNHRRGKPHKRRIKALQEQPYTQQEADSAAGLGQYKPRLGKRRIEEPVKPELALRPPPAKVEKVEQMNTNESHI